MQLINILGALLLLAGSLLAQEVRVVSSGSGWSNESHLLLRRDQRLELRAPLLGGKDAGDMILDCPRGWFIYHCGNANCTVPACAEIKEEGWTVKPAPLLSHLREMMDPLVRRQPAELAVAAVRGEGGPSDAAVVQTPQGVHWAPALIRVTEGRYCFRLGRLPTGTAGVVASFTLDWDRSVEKEGIASVPNLKPGLYALEKGTPGANASCRLDANAAPAWVLVVPQASFEGIDKQWDENSSQVDELEQSGAATSVVLTLRHAILAWLAESVEGK